MQKIAATLIVLLLTSLLSNFLRAQDITKVPELLKDLANSKTAADSADNLALICYNYANSDIGKGLLYGDSAMQLSTKINYKKGIADAYNNMGWLYYRKGEYTKSEEYLLQALKRFAEIGNPKFTPVSCSNLGWLYLSQSDFPKSMKYFLMGLEYAQATHDSSILGYNYYNIGVVYNRQQKPKEARKYFEQALSCYIAADKKTGIIDANQSIGNSYNTEGNYKKAEEYYRKAFDKIDQKDFYKAGMIHENIGDLNFRQEKWQDALQQYHLAEKSYQQINSKEDIAYIAKLIGKTYYEQNNTKEALKAYERGLSIAVELQNKNLEQQFYEFMSSVYKKENDYRNAFTYYEKAIHIKDSLFTADREVELLKLQTQFETKVRENENKILKAENESANVKLQQNRLSLLFSVMGIVILIIIGLLLRRNYLREKKHSDELTILNAALRSQQEEIETINRKLAMKALRAQMNPHFIFNCLNSLQECILMADIEKANHYLSRFSRLLRMTLESSDEDYISLSRELEMLEIYLSMEAGRMRGSFHYEIEVDADEETEVPSLLLQPLVENAIWHGLAGKTSDRNLKVQILREDDKLKCVVEDNGLGRGTTSKSSHISKGIKILNERLALLNQSKNGSFLKYDDLTVNGQPTGTRVTLEFPYTD